MRRLQSLQGGGPSMDGRRSARAASRPRWALCLWLLAAGCGASNWAQTTGPLKQNTVIPYMPSAQNPHWSARMGFAVAVSNVSDNGEALFRSQPSLMLVGGDDYWVDAEARDGFDQANPVHGLRNDVWRLKTPEPQRTWVVDHDMIDRGRYKHKVPKIHSQLRWDHVSTGEVPRQHETYEDFIMCQDNYPPYLLPPAKDCAAELAASGRSAPRGWFSARRMHQVAIYGDMIFVIGGRAREGQPLSSDRLVGGLVGSPNKESEFESRINVAAAAVDGVRREPSMRQANVLKNDVWSSTDWGSTWTLQQPGCHSNQLELLPTDPIKSRDSPTPILAEAFNAALRCRTDSDCYGNQEVCNREPGAVSGVCMCTFWSPREQHRVAVFGGNMYLVGGFASRHLSYCEGRFCGDVDAGAYRAYMNDIWYSKLDGGGAAPGALWLSLPTADFAGRGGHAIAVMAQLYSRPNAMSSNSGFALFVMGGKTGFTSDASKDQVLNDVWYIDLPKAGLDPAATQQGGWTRAKDADWAPRTGLVAVVDPPSANNGGSQRVHVSGGEALDGSLFGDTWSWGWECRKDPETGVAYVDGDNGPECSAAVSGGTLVNATRWRRDYDPDALFRYESGGAFVYDEGAPQQHYVDGNSPVEDLVQVYLPLDVSYETFDSGFPSQMRARPLVYGHVPRRKGLIDAAALDFMHQLNIHTISDLASASQADVLRLRGYVPQAPASERFGGQYDELFKTGYNFDIVCDHIALAAAVMDKCAVDVRLHPLVHYDAEAQAPMNVEPDFAGPSPAGKGDYPWRARWHGKWFNSSEALSDEELISRWDGCAGIGMDPVNVPGVGDVKVPSHVQNPEKEAEDLVCKSNPGARAFHAGVYLDQKIYVMGGLVPDERRELRSTRSMRSTQDMWYRDDKLPRATIYLKPEELVFGDDLMNIFKTAEDNFKLRADKEGSIFEYEVYDYDEHLVARTWDQTMGKAHVNWLDFWFEGGPGSGTYIFYARCLDPAGNMDITYGFENMYKWKYQTALPWNIISGCMGGLVGLSLLAYWEFKRRKKKKAMERYAIKRMRRKFKGAQKELNAAKGVDYRAMMDKDKRKGKGKGAKTKSKEKKPKVGGSKALDKEKAKKKKDKSREKEKLKKKKE
ncbi:hypothetical protein M885DRAFT_480910 [Pelagophyceae sp. CCMP2097]|nr:hypothetical protein M885DRAFT_480910 [Pelagophyceae sp. CCMP2097]